MLKTEEIIEKEIFKLVMKYSKLWHESGKEHEALLFSHQKAIADEIMSLLSQQKEACREDVILKSDLARAIGHMQGCGHPDQYLEDKYPEFKEKSLS